MYNSISDVTRWKAPLLSTKQNTLNLRCYECLPRSWSIPIISFCRKGWRYFRNYSQMKRKLRTQWADIDILLENANYIFLVLYEQFWLRSRQGNSYKYGNWCVPEHIIMHCIYATCWINISVFHIYFIPKCNLLSSHPSYSLHVSAGYNQYPAKWLCSMSKLCIASERGIP